MESTLHTSDAKNLPYFDQINLTDELLSLGHRSITPHVARHISQEVGEELQRGVYPRLSTDLISQLVQFKLEELGLIEVGSRKIKKTKAHPHQKDELRAAILSGIEKAQEEVTEIFSVAPTQPEKQIFRTDTVSIRKDPSHLPTLEKMLFAPYSNNPTQQHLQRARVVIDPQVLSDPNLNLGNVNQLQNYFEKIFLTIASEAAKIETTFSDAANADELILKFFNLLANQEFYPHNPELLGVSPLSAGSHQIWITLPPNVKSIESSLQYAQEIWKKGGLAHFVIHGTQAGEELNLESFEQFLAEVENKILELPEEIQIPARVGLSLSWNHPRIVEFIHIITSEKYYPRFSVYLRLPEGAHQGLAHIQNSSTYSPQYTADNKDHLYEIEQALCKIWKNRGLNLCFAPKVLNNTFSAEIRPAEYFRPDGGPALANLEGCYLGTINLAVLVTENRIDWDRLKHIVHTAVHFLDNLIEIATYPHKEISKNSYRTRKIGLGIMGFAEFLQKLDIAYDSKDALAMAEKMMAFIDREARLASSGLAKSRGVFPDFESSKWKDQGVFVRHASLTAIAPALLPAQLAGVHPGIEPAVNKISAFWKLRVQAAFQRHTEGLVHTHIPTMEFSSHETLEDIIRVANKEGLRQICLEQNLNLTQTVLRRDALHSHTNPKATPQKPVPNPHKGLALRERPKLLNAIHRTIHTGCGTMKITSAYDAQGTFEIHATLGKAGTCTQAQSEAISRLVTLLLRAGIHPNLIREELEGIRCPLPSFDQDKALSCPDAIARSLENPAPSQNKTVAQSDTSPEDDEITVVMEKEDV